jgi:hypothetical protein
MRLSYFSINRKIDKVVVEIRDAIHQLTESFKKATKDSLPSPVIDTVFQKLNESIYKTLNREEKSAVIRLYTNLPSSSEIIRPTWLVLSEAVDQVFSNRDVSSKIFSFVGGVPSPVTKDFKMIEERVYTERLAQLKQDPIFSRFIPDEFRREILTPIEAKKCVKLTEKKRQESLDANLIKVFPELLKRFNKICRSQGLPLCKEDPSWSGIEGANAIRGYLKEHSGLCAKIKNLDLIGFNLTEIPPEIGLLTQLQRLNVNANKISFFPKEIGNLINLEWICVDSNQLTTLPQEITTFLKLEHLSANNNPLIELPQGLENLQNLTQLDFSGSFTVLPEEIWSLVNLEKLDFKIPLRTLSSEIHHLTNLERLSIFNSSELRALPIEELASLSELTSLTLLGNTLPEGILTELRSRMPSCSFYGI